MRGARGRGIRNLGGRCGNDDVYLLGFIYGGELVRLMERGCFWWWCGGVWKR
jgi:hypothetical protein